MSKLLIFLVIANAAAHAQPKPTIAIRDGKLCLVQAAETSCLYKDEWQDRLKALQEYMQEHQAELKTNPGKN